MHVSSLFSFFESLKNIDKSLGKIEKNITRIPDFLLEDPQKIKKILVLKEK